MDVFFEQLFLLGITTKATRGIIPSSDLLSACGRINSIPPKCYDIWWLSMQLQALSNAGHRPTRPIARLLGVRNAKCEMLGEKKRVWIGYGQCERFPGDTLPSFKIQRTCKLWTPRKNLPPFKIFLAISSWWISRKSKGGISCNPPSDSLTQRQVAGGVPIPMGENNDNMEEWKNGRWRFSSALKFTALPREEKERWMCLIVVSELPECSQNMW